MHCDHTVTRILDQYCLARSVNDTKRQLEIANLLVDEVIPTMLSLLHVETAQGTTDTHGK